MEENRELGGKLNIQGKTYAIFGGVNTIGRNREAVVNIKNLSISQHHAMLILVDDDLHFISDLKSSNGTFLNGIRLVPLQLYCLDNGASLNFGDVKGTYQKCSSEESNGSTTTGNETQTYYSQSFYGNETQMLENTEICNKKQAKQISQNSYYIPTQVLAKVANSLEVSYNKLHEQPTQVIPPKENENRTTQMLPPSLPTQLLENKSKSNNINVQKNDESEAGPSHSIEDSEQSIFDFHEAETQKIPVESVNSIESSKNVEKDSDNNLEHDVHELETQVFPNENESVIENIEVPQIRDSPSSQLVIDETMIEENGEVFTENKSTSKENSEGNLKSDISQDSDIVRPLGKSRNFLDNSQLNGNNSAVTSETDQKNSDLVEENHDDSLLQRSETTQDSDIVKPVSKSKSMTFVDSPNILTEDSDNEDIRPLKKPINIFNSIDTLEESEEDKTKKSSKSDDVDDEEEDIIRPVRKSHIDLFNISQSSTVNEEDSNDSVDFMTMQKISEVEKKNSPERKNSDEITKVVVSEEKVRLGSVPDSEDSETDMESEDEKRVPVKYTISESETDNEEEKITSNEGSRDLPKENFPKNNVSLNDSDFIPSTQESQQKIIKIVKTISQSSCSKFENSEESFKLGLTQLMEEETDNKSSQEKKNNLKQTNEEEISKKFTFKKINPSEELKENQIHQEETQKLLENVEINTSSDVETKNNEKENCKDKNETLELPEKEFYQAQTQKLSETENCLSDEEEDLFLHPTQTPLGLRKIKRKDVTKNREDEDLYSSSTQKLEESPKNNEKNNSLESIYLQPTQKCKTPKGKETTSESPKSEEKLDDDDIFATQQMDSPKTTPSKILESELECMFATQRLLTSNEDSLDRIQNVICEKPLVDTKLPEDDEALEAILATQKMLESPRSSRSVNIKEGTLVVSGRTIESQLEVLFASQTNKLPADKFNRPGNPLADIFEEEVSQEVERKIEDNPVTTSILEVSNRSLGASTSTKTNGLEQSFALLDSKATKTRKSSRNNKISQEITVSCSKSRRSLALAPNDNNKLKKVLEESITNGGVRKRRGSSSSEASSMVSSTLVSKKPKRSIATRKTKAVENSEEKKNKREPLSGDANNSSSSDSMERKQRDVSEDDSSSVKSTRSRRKPERLIEKSEVLDVRRTGRRASELSDKSADSAGEFEETRIGRRGGRKANGSEDSRSDVSSSNSSNVKRRGKSMGVVEKKGGERGVSEGLVKEDVEVMATPAKIRRRNEKMTTPSTSRDDSGVFETPNRSKRKLKPKVIFTMMDSPQLESTIRQLGGSVVDNVSTSTVLITQSVKRSMKLLSAVGLGKPICSSKWIEESKKEGQFLDPWDYLLIDKEAEKKWDFSLKMSLERSSQAKLFEGYTFHLLVTNALDVLKGAIECCGGKIVARVPKGGSRVVVVASVEQKDRYKKLLKQNSTLTCVEPEAIFDGVLRQEIRFEKHILR